VSKAEAFSDARRLIQEAVDVVTRAGIDPAVLVAPHCAEIAAAQADAHGRSSDNLNWCGVSVIIDEDLHELFEMSKPDHDPEQKPTFLVTQSTADLVREDFERYEPSLERMAEAGQENKKFLCIKKTSD